MVMDNVKLKQRNISTACINYKKAFDFVPHNWIIKILKIHKFDPIITMFSGKQWISGKRRCTSITEMVKLKPIIFQSILPSFKMIAPQGYYSHYRYFHSLGYWTQATLDIELIAKVILYHISYSWTILNSLLQQQSACINDKNRQ